MGDVVKLTPSAAPVPEQVAPAGADTGALAEVAAKSIAAMTAAEKTFAAEAKTTADQRAEGTRAVVDLTNRVGSVERAVRWQRWGMLAMAVAFLVDAAARVFG